VVIDRLLTAMEATLTVLPAPPDPAATDRIRQHLLLHPLDRIDDHLADATARGRTVGGLTPGAAATLVDRLGWLPLVLHGPAAELAWLPPGLCDAGAVRAWEFAPDVDREGRYRISYSPGLVPDDLPPDVVMSQGLPCRLPRWAARAAYPLDPHRRHGLRVVAPRDLLAAGGSALLVQAAEILDQLRDRDQVGRRDAAHLDPALDDRSARSWWPSVMYANQLAGKPYFWFRQPPWAVKRPE
jgi:hypothetical protein